jgi:hypothetical protein
MKLVRHVVQALKLGPQIVDFLSRVCGDAGVIERKE